MAFSRSFRMPIQGLLPKFDLMWFMPLARLAELRWANKVEEALAETKMSGKAEEWLRLKLADLD